MARDLKVGLQIPAPAPIPQIAAAVMAAAALAEGYARVQQIRAQRPPQAFALGGGGRGRQGPAPVARRPGAIRASPCC